MSAPPCLKKPKLEADTVDEVIDMDNENDNGELNNNNNNNNSMSDREEQEEALIALIEHRTKEVEHLRKRVSYYFSQLEQSEKRLKDSESRLARLRRGDNAVSSKNALENGTKKVKVESGSNSFNENIDESSSKSQRQSRTELLIPALKPKISQPLKLTEPGTKGSTASGGRSVPSHSNNITKLKGDKSQREQEAVESQDKGAKRKFEEKEHQELIPSICSRSSPCLIRCHTSSHISSQHKRKLRSLAICPVNDQLFVTSALDGVVNLWQIQGRGSGASLLSSADCLSPKQRRWPEDLAWHPQGNSVVFTYTADDGDSQISVMNLNKTEERARVTFLEDKPHVKGIINNINFLPSHATCFVTGGSDHAVILWNEKNGGCSWKPKALHRNLHSSSVMGVAGMQQKQVVISVGADKRIVGFDLLAERTEFKHQVESKCMSVLPNPCDFNLYMVQTATPERQLKLFDVRLRQTEIHAFGWKQESSESQSALINQAWSPDGYYISSGSADPIIHIFDIRYNVHKPSQSVKAHQKRVFKAVWHFSLPLLISISSDLNIGLHKIS